MIDGKDPVKQMENVALEMFKVIFSLLKLYIQCSDHAFTKANNYHWKFQLM